MAYNNQNAAASRNSAPGKAADSNFTKANGFINIYLAQPDDKKVKIGALPMYSHKDYDRQIMEHLMVTGENDAETLLLRAEALKDVLDMLTIDFVPVSDEPKKLVLPSRKS